LVEHWDGSSWSVVQVPNPGPKGNYLNGVSASSSTDVWAVGSQLIGSATDTLIEHWDGQTWTATSGSNPSSISNQLLGVSALSATNVWAVGSDIDDVSGAFVTLTEHWDGTSWTVVSSPSPSPIGQNSLKSVVDLSPTNAWAVGGFQTAGGGGNTLILNWYGVQWNISPNPTGAVSSLNAVAAVASKDIWAMGGDTDPQFHQHSRAEHWDGKAWKEVHTPAQGTGYLSGAAFASAALGWAVGSVAHQNGETSIVGEFWDGTSWTVQAAPGPGKHTNLLLSVAAVAPGTAWAVGIYNNARSQNRTLIESITC
jgi:hypothetical protein